MILRVVARQFGRTLRVWIGVLVVAAASAAATCASFLQIATAQELVTNERQGILSLAYGQMAFTLVATLIIAGSSAGFAVTAIRVDLARMQLIGVSPSQIVLFVSTQAACASLAGATIGVMIGVTIAQPWLDSTVAFTAIRHHVSISYAASNVFATIVVVAGVMILGATRAAIRAGRVPAVQAVRGLGGAVTQRRVRGGKIIVVLATGGVSMAFAAALVSLGRGDGQPLAERDLSLVVGLSVLFALATLSFVAAIIGSVVPVITMAWAFIIPASFSLSWHLARSGVRRRAGRSNATVIPIMIAVSIPSALMTTFLTAGSSMGGASATNVNVGGLTVLIAPALGIALVGAAMLTLMDATAQRSRLALVEVLGAQRTLAVKIALAEASILVVNATILALVLALIVGKVTSMAFGPALGVLPVVSYDSVAIAAISAWLLMIAITTLPTIISRPRTLTDAFRDVG